MKFVTLEKRLVSLYDVINALLVCFHVTPTGRFDFFLLHVLVSGVRSEY